MSFYALAASRSSLSCISDDCARWDTAAAPRTAAHGTEEME
jgi:hypothetical protein